MRTIRHLAVLLGVLGGVACKTGGDRRDKSNRGADKDPMTQGGVNDGNTGELTTTKNNPWFVGVEPAHYCVQFGVELADDAAAQTAIAEQVDAAFAQWADLLKTFDPNPPGSKTTNGDFLAGKGIANLTRDFQRVACAANPEMRIKVGTWEKSDADFLKFTSRYTVAYALRTGYSDETGRSRGFLWLVADRGDRRYKGPAPDGAFWSQGRYVQNVVLHELGHVFGLEHLPTTFMDASFPAGVLAAKLAAAWAPDDLKALREFVSETCASLDLITEDKDRAVLKDVFGVEPALAKTLCWRAANERREPGDEGTPQLVWIKGDGDVKLAEQLMRVDGVYGKSVQIGGNYLKRQKDGDYRYAPITHAYPAALYTYRMHFTRGGKQYWAEAEAQAPGVVTFRFGYDGPWKTIAVLLLPLDRVKAIYEALRAASFDDDAVADD